MNDANGASISDPTWTNPNYKLDPDASRFTYSIWDLQNWEGPASQGGVTYSNGGYYVTFSVDRSTVGTTNTPTVHARLVDKSTGNEVETLDMTAGSTYKFNTLVNANSTYTPQFEYTTGDASQILGTWTNNRDADQLQVINTSTTFFKFVILHSLEIKMIQNLMFKLVFQRKL
ncbi:MAG: hypothetical protein ACLS9T_07915 [Streptococcus salivarius]